MGYGRVAEPGEWLGDIIGVSDSRPEGYLLLKKLYMDRQMIKRIDNEQLSEKL